MTIEDGIQRTAYIDGPYRYILRREWSENQRGLTVVMLNPSTADGLVDDPTVRRCIGFAKRWGYGSISIVNVYALRATNPHHLPLAADPIGWHNQAWLVEACAGADVLCAWGAWLGPIPQQARNVVMTILSEAKDVYALGYTAEHQPRHPLYVRAATDRIDCRAHLRTVFKL